MIYLPILVSLSVFVGILWLTIVDIIAKMFIYPLLLLIKVKRMEQIIMWRPVSCVNYHIKTSLLWERLFINLIHTTLYLETHKEVIKKLSNTLPIKLSKTSDKDIVESH